VITILGSKGAN